ncbi:hypothetical protein LTR86_005972 [Recurvomyces mirabilis]|nr:hypothetical protein LTR86_005972 [Recurvomyces mirabilis]
MNFNNEEGLYLESRAIAMPTLDRGDDIDEEAGLIVGNVTVLQPRHASLRSAPNKRPRLGFNCVRCSKPFTEKRSLVRHERQTNCIGPGLKEYPCDLCHRVFAREETRKRHKDERHLGLKRPQADPKRKIRSDQHAEECVVPATEGPANCSLSLPDVLADVHTWNFITPELLDDSSSYEPSGLPFGTSGSHHDVASSIEEALKHTANPVPDYVPNPAPLRSMQSITSLRYDSAVDLLGKRSTDNDLIVTSDYSSESADIDQVDTAVSSVAALSSGTDTQSRSGISGGLQQDNSDLSMWDLLDLDAISSEHINWLEWLPSAAGEPGNERSTDDDDISIHSTQSQSRASIRSMLGRMRSKRATGPYNNSSTIRPYQRLLENCLYCSEPWEREDKALRQHLDKHIQDLFSKTNAFCEHCQLSFVTQDALDQHQRTVALNSCCSLPKGHLDLCGGKPCGFDFKHDEPCTGHHPMTDLRAQWSDHDRLKYGQLMWELVAQASALRIQAAKVDMHARVRRCLSHRSLPSPRKWRHSTASLVPSIFSWLSEPHGETYDVEDLQLSLSQLTMNSSNRRTSMRRGFARIVGTQLELDTQLYLSVAKNDLHSVARLVERGASCHRALLQAIKRGDCNAVKTLWAVAGTLLAESDLTEAIVTCGTSAVNAVSEANIELSRACALEMLYLALHKVFGPDDEANHALLRLALLHIPNINSPGLSNDAVMELRRAVQQMTNIKLLMHNNDSNLPLAWAAAGRDIEAARLLVAGGTIADHITVLIVFNRNPEHMKMAWVEALLGNTTGPSQAHGSQIMVS